jgi:hypothetical protein
LSYLLGLRYIACRDSGVEHPSGQHNHERVAAGRRPKVGPAVGEIER